MQGTTMLNTTCSSVQDAHLTNDAANMVANDFAFVFAPVLFGAFMVFAIAVSLFAAVKSKSAEGGIWVFIMMLILGTVIGPVPWYATGLFAAIFLGFKAYGRVSNA
jgi:cation transport ATPase